MDCIVRGVAKSRTRLSDFHFPLSASPSVFPVHIQGLISLTIDWFDLLPAQENFMSLLQHQFEGINYRPLVKVRSTLIKRQPVELG